MTRKNRHHHREQGARSLFLIVAMAISAAALGAEGKRPILEPVANSLSAVSGSWVAQGAAPIYGGQLEGIANRPAVGAASAVVAHPSDANTLWAGTVNGGIWKTTNATSSSPTWTPQTDALSSLSISALVRDPTDSTNNTLVGGVGGYSSYYRISTPLGSLLRTTNGGTSWSTLNPTALAGMNISGIVARGATIVVSVSMPTSNCITPIYRSTNTGSSFSAASGLPSSGYAFHVTGDPSNNAVLYAAVYDCSGSSGVYKSTDTGANWTRVSNATMNTQFASANNAKIAVGASGQVYVGIVVSSQLGGLFRSGNGGANWTQLDTPTTTESGSIVYGIHPGGQGYLHFSIAADPSNTNLVYVGGDRQPAGWPNSIGATDYDGRLFRVNAAASSGSQSTPLTHCTSATAACNSTISTNNNSAPHADSRSMTFDANGSLIETDDGGIYRRTSPSGTGDWASLNTLQIGEMHDVVYDHISKMIMSGDQDTGTPEQTSIGGTTWTAVLTADGGDVGADDLTSSTQSTRYCSFQWLGGFRRRIMNTSGVQTSFANPALTVIGGGASFQGQFVTPLELNRVDPRRLLLAGYYDLYESLDRGDTITALGLNLQVTAAVYGGRASGVDNLDLIWAVAGSGVYVRTSGSGTPAATSASPGGTLRDIAVDSTDWHKAWVVNDNGQVFYTSNTGSSWTDVTGNLGSGTTDLRAIEFIAGSGGNVVAAGGLNGVFRMSTGNAGTWNQFGSGLPNSIVADLDYDATDDVLVAGTLGRGAWTLTGVAPVAAPTNVTATATTTTNVHVTWTGSAGASSYEVWRSSGGGSYISVGTPSASPFDDTTASANTAYLYKVRAHSSGGAVSVDSNIDLATTVIFTDPTLTAGTTLVKAVHFTELLTAVNAVRALAGGYGAISFTTPAPASGVSVLAAHVSDLRNGLNPARSTLGLSALSYTDSTLTPGSTKIKAAHINELRNGVQ
ncbi:MAG TPA: RTX toxin [Thermoanaerobaculia bacterium]